jgi:hypothetical protein
MNDFTKEELIQILNFYKNKSIELEFSFLALQLKNKKDLKEQEINLSNQVMIKEGQIKLDVENFKKENEKLKIENLKLKKSNKIVKNKE